MENVHALIVKKKYSDAQFAIESYLNKAENIHWYGHAYFLKAFLYEQTEDYDQSIKWYRRAIKHGTSYDSRVQAKALYNLSFVYEREARFTELLTVLVDLIKRRDFFDVLTGQVEIPARLAAAYSFHGRPKEALIFHREAANNYKLLVKNQRFRSSPDEVSKSLYYLGLSTFDENDEEFDRLISKLNLGQKYYLASFVSEPLLLLLF